MELYEVEDFSLGDKATGDMIIFKSIKNMEEAYKKINDGKDIYVVKEGLVTKLLNQMLSTKVYDGSIKLSARKQKDETVGVE